MAKLCEQGVKIICFSHDPETFGKEYYSSVMSWIKKMGCDVSLYWESFRLPSSDFIIKALNVFNSLEVSISLESASEEVREINKPMSYFTNKELMRALEFLEQHGVSTGIHFLIGLPGETEQSCRDKINMSMTIVEGKKNIWISRIIPYTIDPHCIMALNPKQFGVKLFFNTFRDYCQIPCFSRETHYWIGHETTTMSRTMISDMTDTVGDYINNLHQEGLISNYRFWFS